jgi:hypothetical protein
MISLKSLLTEIIDDNQYLELIKNNDQNSTKKMVEAAAKRNGYKIGPVWHGSPTKQDFNTFKYKIKISDPSWKKESDEDMWFDGNRWEIVKIQNKYYLTGRTVGKSFSSLENAMNYADKESDRLNIHYKIITTRPAFFFAKEKHYARRYKTHDNPYGILSDKNQGSLKTYYLKLNNVFNYKNPKHQDFIKKWLENNKDKVLNDLDKDLNDDEWIQQLNHILKLFSEGYWGIVEIFPELIDEIKKLGFDGYMTREGGEFPGMSRSTNFAVFDSHQIKSADIVTYDDNKQIIPLSQRFDSSTEDIRY